MKHLNDFNLDIEPIYLGDLKQKDTSEFKRGQLGSYSPRELKTGKVSVWKKQDAKERQERTVIDLELDPLKERSVALRRYVTKLHNEAIEAGDTDTANAIKEYLEETNAET